MWPGLARDLEILGVPPPGPATSMQQIKKLGVIKVPCMQHVYRLYLAQHAQVRRQLPIFYIGLQAVVLGLLDF